MTQSQTKYVLKKIFKNENIVENFNLQQTLRKSRCKKTGDKKL